MTSHWSVTERMSTDRECPPGNRLLNSIYRLTQLSQIKTNFKTFYQLKRHSGNKHANFKYIVLRIRSSICIPCSCRPYYTSPFPSSLHNRTQRISDVLSSLPWSRTLSGENKIHTLKFLRKVIDN